MNNYNPYQQTNYPDAYQQRINELYQQYYPQHTQPYYNQNQPQQPQQNIQQPQQQPQKVVRCIFVLSEKEVDGQAIPLNEIWLFLCPNENRIYSKFIGSDGNGKKEIYQIMQNNQPEQYPDTTQMFNYIANELSLLKGMLNYEPEPDPSEPAKPKSKPIKPTTDTGTGSTST